MSYGFYFNDSFYAILGQLRSDLSRWRVINSLCKLVFCGDADLSGLNKKEVEAFEYLKKKAVENKNVNMQNVRQFSFENGGKSFENKENLQNCMVVERKEIQGQSNLNESEGIQGQSNLNESEDGIKLNETIKQIKTIDCANNIVEICNEEVADKPGKLNGFCGGENETGNIAEGVVFGEENCGNNYKDNQETLGGGEFFRDNENVFRVVKGSKSIKKKARYKPPVTVAEFLDSPKRIKINKNGQNLTKTGKNGQNLAKSDENGQNLSEIVTHNIYPYKIKIKNNNLKKLKEKEYKEKEKEESESEFESENQDNLIFDINEEQNNNLITTASEMENASLTTNEKEMQEENLIFDINEEQNNNLITTASEIEDVGFATNEKEMQEENLIFDINEEQNNNLITTASEIEDASFATNVKEMQYDNLLISESECEGNIDLTASKKTKSKNKAINKSADSESKDEVLLTDVERFVADKNLYVDAKAFYFFYKSKGWKVGSCKLVDWRSKCMEWHYRKVAEKTDGMKNACGMEGVDGVEGKRVQNFKNVNQTECDEGCKNEFLGWVTDDVERKNVNYNGVSDGFEGLSVSEGMVEGDGGFRKDYGTSSGNCVGINLADEFRTCCFESGGGVGKFAEENFEKINNARCGKILATENSAKKTNGANSKRVKTKFTDKYRVGMERDYSGVDLSKLFCDLDNIEF